MNSRLKLQATLEKLLNSKQVYYQPPENIKMTYPAIIYSKSNIKTEKANNLSYLVRNRYEITIIDKRPDNNVINKLLELPYCSFDRHYKSDGLNHDVLTIYY